jgi:hypothetical protein
VRYRQVTTQIEEGRFTVGFRGTGAVITSAVLVLSVVIALVILVLTR